MKNQIFATLSSLTLLTACSLFAQSSAVMHAEIPFEFRVGRTILPPGHYDVRPQAEANVLSIRCFECRTGAMILTQRVEAGKTAKTGTLVFNRYENTYFLFRVWTPGYSHGREIPKSTAERELAHNGWRASPVAVALIQR